MWKNKAFWKFVVNALLYILSGIATALGITACARALW